MARALGYAEEYRALAMAEKRNPRPTQKIVPESLERMARVSTTHGIEPLRKPEQDKPRDSQLQRQLARTVKRVDLPGMNATASLDEDDWGEIAIAEGSGGVADDAVVVDVDEMDESQPTTSRVATVDDPLTMAMLAEVARSSKTGDFGPAQIDEAHRMAEGAHAERGDPTPPPPHPRIKRRGE